MRFFCCSRPEPDCRPKPDPVEKIDFYAQYGVQANPPSKSDLPLITMFQQGEQIHLDGTSDIILAPSYLYLIDYVFIAVPEPDGFMQIVPRINGTPRLLYAFYAPTGKERVTSASGSFTTNEAATEEIRLSFNLTYSDTARNIDITGTVSVTPVMKL